MHTYFFSLQFWHVGKIPAVGIGKRSEKILVWWEISLRSTEIVFRCMYVSFSTAASVVWAWISPPLLYQCISRSFKNLGPQIANQQITKRTGFGFANPQIATFAKSNKLCKSPKFCGFAELVCRPFTFEKWILQTSQTI
jgi:hypothetical protein